MLILGGAATINALTGMSTYAANFMIPVPVMLYTAFGGLKGTYYASFTHTAVIVLFAPSASATSVAHASLQCPSSPPTRGSRWMTADLVQDAALDTDTVARVTTKLYSAARPPRAALHLEWSTPNPFVGQGI